MTRLGRARHVYQPNITPSQVRIAGVAEPYLPLTNAHTETPLVSGIVRVVALPKREGWPFFVPPPLNPPPCRFRKVPAK